MEKNKTCILKKLTAFAMALIMVLSVGITPAFAAEEDFIAAVGEELYVSLQAAADEAENGETVELLCDASGDGIFVKGDKSIIFDFGGYTYTVDGKLVGSNGTQSQAMHLEKGAKVTLRNGTLKAGGDVRMLVQNYCELTLVDFSLDTNGKKIYALSNNFGNVLVTGKSDITSEAAAFDLWYNLQGGYPEGISVTFDENYEGTVKGNIEYGAYKNMNTEGWTEKVALTIKNGTFLGEIEKSSDFAEKANITVYGGSFSDADVADYCAEYHTVAAADEGYRVLPCVSDGEGKAYASLQQAVDAAEGEATVKLNCDLSGDGIFVAGDKNIIFDFGGYTYTVDGKLVGSNGTQSQAMHLEKGAEVTLRNGTLKAGGDVRMLVQNYCELTLVDFSLDTNGKKIYALSNNCGNVLVTGKSNITSEAAAFDLWYNLQGGYPEGISVTFDENYEGTVKGNIEYGAYKNMNTEGWTEKVALTIKNGTFLGEIEKSSDFAEKANITVYGGSFSDADVADYCAEHYKAVAEEEAYRVVPKDYIAATDDGKAYESLQEAVDAAADGAVIALKRDASGDGVFVAGDKNIIFDFGGYTYTVDGKLVGSNGTQSQAMHLEKGAKVTLRNGTLKAGGDVRMLVQNYCELTLVDFSLDTNGKKIYALSNNCGNVLVTGKSNITSEAAAFDLWYNHGKAYSEGVRVTFDESYTGTVTGNIEYGAENPTESWTEKTVLIIRNGTFIGEIKNVSEEILYAGDMNITLYGGSFSEPVMDEWCAQGSEAAEFDDGTYGPCFHDFTEKTEDEDHFFAEPDCENGKRYYYDCSRCKQMGSETYSVGQSRGHNFQSYIYNNDATCEKDGTATAYCDKCNAQDTVTVKNTAGHNMGEWIVTKAATCTVKGTEERTCEVCNKKETRSFTGGHTYSSAFVTDAEAVCGKNGSKSRHCSYCDARTDITTIPAKAHSYKVTVTPSTLKKTGKITSVCTLCGKKLTEDISRIKSVKLSKTSYTYTGKAFKPTVTVKAYNGKKLTKDKDYTVKYSKNKAIGTATVTVTFKGNYSGTKKLTFSIKPAKTESLKLTAKNNAIALSWKTVKGADGYEISYSTSKKFTKKSTKTTVIKKQSTKKTTLKKLKNKKKYYVKIRAYKTVSGKKIYGAYSSVKNVKTK